MKGPVDRTKVVLRHLPPTISQSNLVEQVDSRFSGRYRLLAFRPGKSSLKHLTYSRAYIDFNKPEDVIEFAEYFNGHVFVNEKGTQFKTIVEYAPSQRVPKQWSKKDGREGTILKDPEYLEFLEFLAKPVENLPSAEIQLERREAERAGAPKADPIVTTLMDFVRQKRAANGGARVKDLSFNRLAKCENYDLPQKKATETLNEERTASNGRPARRSGRMPSRSPVSGSSKRGSEKRRAPTTMYVSRDNPKVLSSKDKSAYLLVHNQDDQQLVDKSLSSAAAPGHEALEGESGGPGSTGIGKKILLLKGKEKEIPNVSGGSSLQQNVATPAKIPHSSASLRQNLRREAGGRIIVRSIIQNRDTRQPSSGSQSVTSNQDRDNRPPRSPNLQSFQRDTNGAPEDNKLVPDNFPTEKQERRTRNKERPDRGVWTPLRRSDGSHASDESLSSLSASQTSQVVDSAEGTNVERKHDTLVTRGGRGGRYSVDNGSYRHGGRRGSSYNFKDSDSSSFVEGKPPKRGSSGYVSHEKQMWIQKSSSGT